MRAFYGGVVLFYPDLMHADFLAARKLQYNSCSLGELQQALQMKTANLEAHRLSEPPRKRKNNTQYEIWFAHSHNYIEEIQIIREEIAKRQKAIVAQRPEKGKP